MFCSIICHHADAGRRPAGVLHWIALLLWCAGCTGPIERRTSHAEHTAWFQGFTQFTDWMPTAGTVGQQVTLTSPVFTAPFAFDELIVSWNADLPPGTGLKIQARVLYRERATEFYTLGLWAGTNSPPHRESVVGQQDEDGDVATDTLVLRQESSRAQLKITSLGEESGAFPTLKFVGVCFSRKGSEPAGAQTGPATVEHWILTVPERAQLAYPGGQDWCSPTCVAMVLSYWAGVLRRPDLDADVPAIAAGVFDRNWPGTGNWSFNTAFAGQLRGMRGFVTRLEHISELEDLVKAGVPPILSVSFDLLNGAATHRGGGHLVTCIGFDARGDIVLNDPWAFGSKDGSVRRTVSRLTLAKAWARSRNTVYLIYPEDWPVPPNFSSHW